MWGLYDLYDLLIFLTIRVQIQWNVGVKIRPLVDNRYKAIIDVQKNRKVHKNNKTWKTQLRPIQAPQRLIVCYLFTASKCDKFRAAPNFARLASAVFVPVPRKSRSGTNSAGGRISHDTGSICTSFCSYNGDCINIHRSRRCDHSEQR